MKQLLYKTPILVALFTFILFTSMQAPDVTTVLKGQLVNQETFDVVKNAKIRLSQGEEQQLIISDEEGKFNVKGIPPGIYKVRIQKEGYKAIYFEHFEVYEVQPSYLIVRMRPNSPSYSFSAKK